MFRSERFVETHYSDFASVRRHNHHNPFAAKETKDVGTILDLLDRELDESYLYKKIWNQAKHEFQKKSRYLKQYSYIDNGIPEECYIAIIAYTLDKEIVINGQYWKLYQDFNEKFGMLTSQYSWKNFPYRSFHFLLRMAYLGVHNKPNIDSRSYRGINYQFHPRDLKRKDWFYFDSYSSFTTDRDLALSFIEDHGTLITLPRGAAKACGIDAYSPFDENEILVYPTSRFWVKDFRPNGTMHKLVLENTGSID